jgi:hypothetical protein
MTTHSIKLPAPGSNPNGELQQAGIRDSALKEADKLFNTPPLSSPPKSLRSQFVFIGLVSAMLADTVIDVTKHDGLTKTGFMVRGLCYVLAGLLANFTALKVEERENATWSSRMTSQHAKGALGL